jgi:predicted DNA-binding transcriptional regulator YafY
MRDELYWYDNLIEAYKKCKLTGDDHMFTADEVVAILDCIEMWNIRHDEWEKNFTRLQGKITELSKRIDNQAEIIAAQWEKHPEDAPVDAAFD